MADINECLGIAAKPYRLVLGERVLLVSPVTKGIQGEYESWLKAKARNDLYGMRPHLSPEAWLEEKEDFHVRCNSGFYAFTDKAAGASLKTIDGVAYFFYLTLAKHQPQISVGEVTNLMIEYYQEVSALFREMRPEGESKPPKPTNASGAA